MIKAAIFDMDGVLVDSMMIWGDIGALYLKDIGITPEENLGQILSPLTMAEMAVYFNQHYGINKSEQEVIDGINDCMRKQYEKNIPLKGEVKAFLDRLKEAGVPMCLCTSTDLPLVKVIFEKENLYPYFQRLFTCSEVGVGKTKPDIYLAAAAYMGTKPEETWVFEDSLFAIKTAKKAGFPVVGIEDEFSMKYQEEIKEIADIYLSCLSEYDKFLSCLSEYDKFLSCLSEYDKFEKGIRR